MPSKVAHKFPLTLFEPRKLPFRGMSSYGHPSALAAGWWSLASNVRSDKGVVYMRNGILKRTTTAINSGTGTFGGAGQFPVQYFTNAWNIAAVEVSGAVQLWAAAAMSFAEATSASAPWGSSRMSALAAGDGRVYFAPALYPGDTTNSYTIAQNGADSPRVMNPLASEGSAHLTAIHQAITPPATTAQGRAKLTMPKFFTVKNETTTTLTTPTGTSVAFADTGSNPNNTLTVTATNPTNGNQARIVFSAAIDISACRQLVLTGTSSLANFSGIWNNVKVSVGDSGGLVVVYDPTTAGNGSMASMALSSDGTDWQIAFSLDAYAAQTSNPNMAAIDRVQVEWVGQTLASQTYTVTIYTIMGSGKVNGNALHAITYANKWSRAESAPQFVTVVVPERIYNLGGASNVELAIGNSSVFYYDYQIGFLHTSTAQRNLGVNQLNLYRQDEGESEYWFVETKTIATYSAPNWSFSNHGSTSEYGINSLTDTTYAKSYFRRAPDPEHIVMPVGRAMIAANGRLFLAASYGGGAFSKLYISEHRNSFRYREVPRIVDDLPDPSSGTTHLLDGEDIQGFAAVSVGYGGASYVYIFTNQNIYMIGADVGRIQKIASVGTLSPRSIKEFRGSVYFLDSERKVRVLESGVLRDISDKLVEDILKAIPSATWATSRLHKVSGEFWDGCYRLAYSPAGASTNTRCLVWDVEEQKWYDDAFTGSITGEELLAWTETGKRILLCFGNNLHVYEVEKSGQATDDGTNPTLTLTTSEFRMEDWLEFTIGRVGIICDDVASGSVSVTRNYRPGTGSGSTSTINVDASGTTTTAWRYDGAITQGNLRGTFGKLTLTLQAPAATNIYELMCWVHPRGQGATVPAS